MDIRVPRNANALETAQAYLSMLGIKDNFRHAHELLARMHGYADARAMERDTAFASPSTLTAKSSGEFALVSPSPGGAWISVENISVHISKGAKGVEVNLFAKDCHHEPLVSLELGYAQAKTAQDEFAAEAELPAPAFYPIRDELDDEPGALDPAMLDMPAPGANADWAPRASTDWAVRRNYFPPATSARG